MKKIILPICLVILLVGTVSAFFPITHKYQQAQLMDTYSGNSEFYDACQKHPDACYVGNVLTDLSVVWYYINGGENYIITHSPSFARANLRNAVGEVEYACAVGSGLHATQDYQSHNIMVPDAIKRTGIPNSVLHVFAEQHIDNLVSEKYPYVVNDISLLGNDSWNKCIPLFKKTLEGFSAYEDEIDSGKLDDVIYVFIDNVQDSITAGNTGYDVSFRSKVSVFGKLAFVPMSFLITYIAITFLFATLSILLLFRDNKTIINYLTMVVFSGIAIFLVVIFSIALFGNAFNTMVTLIKPTSDLVPIGNFDTHMRNSIENGYSFFNQGEQWLIDRQSPDASGFTTLKQADKEGRWLLYLIIGICVALLYFLIYLNFRRKDVKDTFNF